MHTVIASLTRPEFSGLTGAITTLRLPTLRTPDPSDLNLSLETFDLLNSDAFPNLQLSTFAVQDAAIEGNLSFLRYAVERGALANPNQNASQLIDAGYLTNTMLQSLPHITSGAAVISRHFDVIQAAIMGGDRNTIHYLSSLDAFKNYNSLDAAIELAAKYGQIDTVLALAEANNRPASIEAAIKSAPPDMGIEILQRYQAKFPSSNDLDRASPLLIEKAIRANQLNLLDRMLRLGVSINHADNAQKDTIVRALDIKAIDGLSSRAVLEAARSLDDTNTLENDLLLYAAASNNPALISIKLNENRNFDDQVAFGDHDNEAALSVSHLKFPDSESGKNDYQSVSANTLQVSQARELVQKALVYSHDRLRTDSNGANGRVNGWINLLNGMKNQPSLSDIHALIDQTLVQLNGMNSNSSVQLNQLRQTAKNTVGDFPLSQRSITSVSGRIGQFFRQTTVDTSPVNVPAGEFIPGKGFIAAPLYAN